MVVDASSVQYSFGTPFINLHYSHQRPKSQDNLYNLVYCYNNILEEYKYMYMYIHVHQSHLRDIVQVYNHLHVQVLFIVHTCTCIYICK